MSRAGELFFIIFVFVFITTPAILVICNSLRLGGVLLEEMSLSLDVNYMEELGSIAM